MKSIALISLVVLAVGLYWMMSGEQTESARALSLESAATGQDTGEPSELPLASGTPSTEELAPASERSEVEPAAVVDDPEASPLAPMPLTGQVILSEVSGARLGKLDGTLEVMLWTEHDGAEIEVVGVRQGQFELDVAGLTHITIEDIWLGGRGALLSSGERRFAIDEGPLEVLVEWTRLVRLSVVDDETSEHLSGIRILPTREFFDRGQEHPGPTTEKSLTLESDVSPLDLRASTTQASQSGVRYLVHGQGYAWKSVNINFASGGEREVRLAPGGALSILLIGDFPRGGADVCLVPQSSPTKEPTVLFAVTTQEPVVIEDLKPGHYVVRLQEGRWYDNPIVHGELEVDIIAGVRGEYEMTLEGPPEFTKSRLAGTLVVPAAWNFESFTLSAEYDGTSPDGKSEKYKLVQKQMKSAPAERDAWSFDFGEVVSGTYELSFSGMGGGNEPASAGLRKNPARDLSSFMRHGQRYEALPGLAGNVRLEIPPPAQVTVHVLDEQSGEGASIRSLSWGSLVPPARHPLRTNSLSNSESPGLYKFRAPVGEIKLGSFGGDFTSLQERVQVHSGNNEFTFRLKRNCPLTILFFDGESGVPVAGFWYPKAEHLDGEGELQFTTRNERGFVAALSEPGRYTFPMPEFEGFEAVPDQTISVVRGEMSTHKVQLVRKK